MATQGTPELRPLDLGEKLDVGLRLWTRNFKPLTLGVLIVVVPTAVLGTLLQASVDPNAFSTSSFDFDTRSQDVDEDAQLAGLVVNFALTLLGQALALAVLTKAIADAYTGHAPTWRGSVAYAARRLHSVLWLGFLYVAGVLLVALVGVLALIIGAIIFGTWVAVGWSTALVVLLVEGVRGPGALRRSWRLVKGRWWATFGTLIVAQLLIQLVQAPLAFVLLIFFAAVDSEITMAIVMTFVTIIGYAISLPLGAAITALIYFDLRIRKEGFDLELLAKRIGHEGAVPGGMPMPERKTWTPPGAIPPQPPQPQPQPQPPGTYGGFAPPSSGFAPAPPPPAEDAEPPQQR